MNLKTWNHFIVEVCPNNSDCQACDYFKGSSRKFDCSHPDCPTNWETELKVECSYCHVDMGAKNGKGTTGTSHSICKKCWEKVMPGEPYPKEIVKGTARA